MLCVSRGPGQSIEAGEVKFTVLRIAGTRVQVGIEAPDEVRILRSELVDQPKEGPRDVESSGNSE